MTDEATELPEGWRPEWKPPGARKKAKEESRRKKAEADADKFVKGEIIPPKLEARRAGVKGRPLDDDLKDEICQRIAAGELLSSILRPADMPSRWAVHRAMQSDETFAADMAIAREIAASVLADEVIEISDTASEDYRADGSINYEVIARSKLRTDNRKWLIEKLDPKRWGSKGQIDVTSGGEKIEARDINPLESARQVAFALELAKRAQASEE